MTERICETMWPIATPGYAILKDFEKLTKEITNLRERITQLEAKLAALMDILPPK